MIIIGYQGIGKSTLSKNNPKFIDLESGNFWVNGVRADDWYKPYCNIAEHLSQQGYIVFVSSHEVVRNQLKNSAEEVKCVLPSINLRSFWLRKLSERYGKTELEKDLKAYLNAKERYTENITEIAESGYDVIWITDMNYNLERLITGRVTVQGETKSDETYRTIQALKSEKGDMFELERMSDAQITNNKLDILAELFSDIAMSLANIVDVMERKRVND